MRTVLLALAMSLGLAACTTSAGLLPPESLYPQAMTTCSKFDATTARRADKKKPRTDQQKAKLTARLYDSYRDCKTVVAGWKERRDAYAKQYDHDRYNYSERVWRAVTNQRD